MMISAPVPRLRAKKIPNWYRCYKIDYYEEKKNQNNEDLQSKCSSSDAHPAKSRHNVDYSTRENSSKFVFKPQDIIIKAKVHVTQVKTYRNSGLIWLVIFLSSLTPSSTQNNGKIKSGKFSIHSISGIDFTSKLNCIRFSAISPAPVSYFIIDGK